MKVLLTGATGLLGSHLTELLLNNNVQVHALVRKIPRKSFIGSLEDKYPSNLKLIEADLDSFIPDPSDFFDAVIHAAAKVSADEIDRDSTWHTNFESTKKLHTKLQGKFKKWVQISSIAVLCDGEDVLVDESMHGKARNTHYAQSKLKADQWLMENDKEALIIHPTYMLGRWDSKPSSGAVLFALKFKKFLTYTNNNKNFVGASDVAAGIFMAINAKASGNFILGNENMSIRVFLEKSCKEMNIPFHLSEEILSEATPDIVKEFCLSSRVSSDKARKSFLYSPQKSVDMLLSEVMDYFEQSKILKRSPLIAN